MGHASSDMHGGDGAISGFHLRPQSSSKSSLFYMTEDAEKYDESPGLTTSAILTLHKQGTETEEHKDTSRSINNNFLLARAACAVNSQAALPKIIEVSPPKETEGPHSSHMFNSIN